MESEDIAWTRIGFNMRYCVDGLDPAHACAGRGLEVDGFNLRPALVIC